MQYRNLRIATLLRRMLRILRRFLACRSGRVEITTADTGAGEDHEMGMQSPPQRVANNALDESEERPRSILKRTRFLEVSYDKSTVNILIISTTAVIS